MKKHVELFMSIALLLCAVFLAREGAIFVKTQTTKDRIHYFENNTEFSSTDSSDTVPMSDFCIVIDAGHGGADPGKVGVNDILEKDINLAIALLLSQKLNANGISTVLTRTSDIDLANGAANFKSADMQNRCRIITEANPLFTVSIHQNSYPAESVTGAQVFYFTHSEEGKALASTLQNSLITNVDPTNTRQPKANDNYYLLKKTPTPTVIVECGFLSSPTESALLITPEYQETLTDAICLGILEYLASHHYL